jgi:lipoyl(octanoyl) transferase
LLLVEHDPVITLGRSRASRSNVLLAGDIPVVQVERGGDATWHGPGQLVGYPILRLDPTERDVHAILRNLEDAMIATLVAVGLPGERRAGFTGVWCRGKKLVSIGVAVHGWVTFHGFAVNVDPDLQGFARLNPCGLEAGVMGSVASLGGEVESAPWLKHRVAVEVARAFGRRLVADATT